MNEEERNELDKWLEDRRWRRTTLVLLVWGVTVTVLGVLVWQLIL